MPYDQLIHEYLDRSLTKPEEEQLFEGLAEHPEWREELQLQMKMQQSVQGDLQRVMVPVASTAAIFSSLGFTMPTQTGSLSSAGSTANTVKEFSSVVPKSNLPVAAGHSVLTSSLIGAAGAMLIAGGVWFLQKDDPKPKSANPIPQQSVVSVAKPAERSTPKIIKREAPLLSKAEEPVVKPAVTVPVSPIVVTLPTVTTPLSSPHEHLEMGNFASVDYLSQSQIIGVAEGGRIFNSVDGGKSWSQQASGTTNDLSGINFTDATHGIVVGAHGTILITSSGGDHWQQVQSNTTVDLLTIHYATRDTAYICGARGTILRSINGGANWVSQQSGTISSLFKITFDDGAHGTIRGAHSIVLHTADGGGTWTFEK